MTRPTVSVVIPTYNRQNLIKQAIGSVLQQTFPNLELIVIDDASQDNTQEVVESFADPRIHYICHQQNVGECATRNTGLQVCRGEYVAFLDSDDEWLPHKLETQLQLFDQSPSNVGAVYSAINVVQVDRTFTKSHPGYGNGDIHGNLLYHNLVGTPSTVIVKRDYLQQGLRFDISLRCCGDWDMWLQLSQLCHFKFCADPLVLYREHDDENRGSTNSNAIVEGYLRFIAKHHPRDTFFHQIEAIGTFPRQQKANYLLHIGRRLVSHGTKISSTDAIQTGQTYLEWAYKTEPTQLRFLMHWLFSVLGGQTYSQFLSSENAVRRMGAKLLAK
jgi:glycosyltransferase involved in cell wall biosynthesis